MITPNSLRGLKPFGVKATYLLQTLGISDLVLKKIYIGIIITVIGSLVVLGWALDQFAAENDPVTLPTDLLAYQKIIQGMASQLNQNKKEELSKQVLTLGEQYQVNVALDNLANLALPQALSTQLKAENTLTLQSDTATHFYYLMPAHPESLLTMTIQQEDNQGYFMDVALTLILYLGITLSLIIWLVPLTTRLSSLNKIAAKFGQGELNTRVALSKFSYIEGLEKSFNRMAAQIETLVADNKLLAGGLSHDLRTPVSCLRFGVEAAMECDDVVKKGQYLQRVEQELTRLENMLETFLEYASMERHALSLQPTHNDLAQMISVVIHELSPIAEQKKVLISYSSSGQKVNLVFDGHWLNRAIMNLLSNAMDYCEHRIDIEIVTQSENYVINVHDDGKGVDEDKRDHIFDAFVTANESRSRENTNFGLGLAIVKRVANWHGGEVTVLSSELLGGACFRLVLPKESPLMVNLSSG
jgi:signal transduction histidine kinase